MRLYAYMILSVIFLSIILMPLVEVILVCKDKIEISSAISNSCRVAKNLSLNYENQRNLDAVIDINTFTNDFADTFEEALGLYRSSVRTVKFSNFAGESIMLFMPEGEDFNEFFVTITFNDQLSINFDGSTETRLTIHSESKYKYKTVLLRRFADAINDDYMLINEKNYTLTMQN